MYKNQASKMLDNINSMGGNTLLQNFIDNTCVIDTECLVDYFSVQIGGLGVDSEVKFLSFVSGERFTETDLITQCGTPLGFAWNNGYDNCMLSYLFNDCNGIVDTVKLRIYSDLIIQHQVDTRDRSLWLKQFKLRDLTQFNNDWVGTNRTPKALKSMQIINAVNVMFFDFDEYTTISDIKKDGLFTQFYEYSMNDIISLQQLFHKVIQPKMEMIIHTFNKLNKPLNAEDLFYYSISKLVNKSFANGKISPEYQNIELYDYSTFDNTLISFFDRLNAFDNTSSYDDYFKVVSEDKIEPFNISGCDVVVGAGGIHGFNKDYTRCYSTDEFIIKDVDVGSMYPSLIENLAKYFTQMDIELYKELKIERLKAKKSKDMLTADGLKLLLNSLYGVLGLNSNGNTLFNKQLALSVCFNGQISIIHLMKMIESLIPSGVILQCNTDGVMVLLNRKDEDLFTQIIKEWEIKFNLSMESNNIKYIIQDNVNNYFYEDFNSKIKRKGDYGFDTDTNYIGNFTKDIYTQRVVEQALKTGQPIDDIEIKPYYFKPRKNQKGDYASVSKFTPVYLTINGLHDGYIISRDEKYYFTKDINNSTIECYVPDFYNEVKLENEYKKQLRLERKIKKDEEAKIKAENKIKKDLLKAEKLKVLNLN